MCGARETELRHGYTLGDIEDLSRAAVRRDVWHRSLPLADRLDTAWSAIAEHLYASDEPPARTALIRAAWTALRQETEDEWHTHGVSRAAGVYEGGAVMHGFARYWNPAARAPGPENAVVDRVALAQIWAALAPRHREVLAALAARGDYTGAAQFLDRRRGTVIAQASRARQSFLELWHEGEAPSRPWNLGRTGKGTTRRRSVMYNITRRERRLRREARRTGNGTAASLPKQGSGDD
jgi:hypothetical protein